MNAHLTQDDAQESCAAPTVLVLDPDDFVRPVIGGLLEAAGYRALLCASEAEAKHTIAQCGEPNVLLIEYALRDQDGVSTYGRLCLSDAVPAILMLSGHLKMGCIEEAKGLGMTLLWKPFGMHGLVSCIAEVGEPFRLIRSALAERRVECEVFGSL